MPHERIKFSIHSYFCVSKQVLLTSVCEKRHLKVRIQQTQRDEATEEKIEESGCSDLVEIEEWGPTI